MSAETANKTQLLAAAGVFGLIALCGAFSAYAAVKDFSRARASGIWRQVDGVVLSPARGAPRLRYAYHIDGRSYEGRRLAFMTRGYIARPPSNAPGAAVTVYVSPEDPRQATLVTGGSGRKFAAWLGMAGFAVFIGLAGLIRTVMAIDFPEFDVTAEPIGASRRRPRLHSAE